jgi:hypothetical protein
VDHAGAKLLLSTKRSAALAGGFGHKCCESTLAQADSRRWGLRSRWDAHAASRKTCSA